MTLDEIKQVKNLQVIEEENFIILIPDIYCYIKIEGRPDDEIYYGEVKMLKQDEYSDIILVNEQPEGWNIEAEE